MNFSSVNQLLADSRTCFSPHADWLIDLAEVEQVDSAGVALLVEWLRMAKSQQASLCFRNIPVQMQAIIEVSDLDQRLPLENTPINSSLRGGI